MPEPGRIAVLLRSLDGGGIQRSALTLGAGFVERGFSVDLLVADATGPMRAEVPQTIRLLPLPSWSHLSARSWAVAADPRGATAMWPLLIGPGPRLLRHLPALTRHLRERPPIALLALGTQANLAALWAKRISDVPTRIVISERNAMSAVGRQARRHFRRAYPAIARRVFGQADGIIAVSNAVADDLATVAALPRERIATIYNPAVRPHLAEAALAPLDHPGSVGKSRRSSWRSGVSTGRRTSRPSSGRSRGCARSARRGS